VADRSIRVVLTANASGFISTLGQASNASRKFGQDLSGSVSKNEQSLNKLAGVTGLVGAGLVAGIGGAVRSAADFDQAMSRVAASGDDARGSLESLRDAAIDAGAKTSFSAGEAAAGIENLAKAGVSASDILGGGLAGTLDLAAAGELNVADAASIAATAMTQFNLTGEQLPHVADLLAAGAGKAQGSVEDMGAALKQSGLVASSFGLSIEDTSGTLAAFADAGLIGSDAGTSFKTMLQSLANPSKESAKQMQELGIAAYDAQGNFVGITDLAGQLQTRMSKLTPAVRDQAMAQIFGADAVRASNVLYKEGAAGIQGYIDQTNDAGYASRAAGILLDNLNGDLEGLKGSFETAMIGLGEGAKGPLRTLVQSVTDAVNAFNRLDDSTKGTVLSVAAVGAGALLGLAGIAKLAIGVNDTITAFRGLQTNSPKAADAIGKVGKAAGVAAIALTGLQVLGNIVDNMNGKAVPSLEAVQSSLIGVASGAVGATASMDAFFTVTNKQAGVYGDEAVNGLADSLERLLSKSSGEKINDWGSDLVDSLGGPASVANVLREKFDAVDSSLTKMVSSGQAEEAAKSFRSLRDAAEQRGIGIDKLITLFPDYQATLTAEANSLKVTTLSVEDYADWMGGKVPPAIEAARRASKGATGAFESQASNTTLLKDATKKLESAQDALAKETQTVIDKFSILRDGALDQEDANNAWERSIDDVKDAVKQNGKALDSTSEKGRANREVVIRMIRALNDKTTADFKNTEKTKGLDKATGELSGKMKVGEQRIRDAAKAAGLNTRETQKMIDKFLKTPKQVKTDIKTPGMKDAQNNVDSLGRKIGGLKSKEVNVTANIDVKQTDIAREITKKYGKYAKIPGLATGGPIQNWSGQAVKGKDTELIVAAYGEHMLPADEVDALGGHEGVYRLRNAVKQGKIRGFKDGGAVERSVIVNGSASDVPGIDGLMTVWSTAGEHMGKAAANYIEQGAEKALMAMALGAAEATSGADGNYAAGKAGRYGDQRFNAEQLRNAAIIASVGASMGAHAQRIGIATAIVESGLRNLSYGDRDSVGLFQQRAPWGSFAARTNPRTSADMFFHGGRGGQRGLDDIPGWRSRSLGSAAQAVQVSAFPGRYQTHADEAAAILRGLKSGDGGTSNPGGGTGQSKGGGKYRPVRGGRVGSRYHGSPPAIDIGIGVGNTVYAGHDGRVTISRDLRGNQSQGYRSYGRYITISGDGYKTLYAHLSSRGVSAGQTVRGGQPIGRSGNTGNSTGPHLHFGATGARAGSFFANGGMVGGWSPHSKADNIPIMATAREFMQPVRAVNYYGADAMEALRRLSVPREELRRLIDKKASTVKNVDFYHDLAGMADGGWLRDRRVMSPNYATAAPFYRTAVGMSGQTASSQAQGRGKLADSITIQGYTADDVARQIVTRERREDALHPVWVS